MVPEYKPGAIRVDSGSSLRNVRYLYCPNSCCTYDKQSGGKSRNIPKSASG